MAPSIPRQWLEGGNPKQNVGRLLGARIVQQTARTGPSASSTGPAEIDAGSQAHFVDASMFNGAHIPDDPDAAIRALKAQSATADDIHAWRRADAVKPRRLFASTPASPDRRAAQDRLGNQGQTARREWRFSDSSSPSSVSVKMKNGGVTGSGAAWKPMPNSQTRIENLLISCKAEKL